MKNDNRLTDEIKQFIGFLAGADEGIFFKQYDLTIEQWFNMKNWHNPSIKNEEGKSINEILSYPFGINYFKILLTQMPFWRR